MRDVAIEEKQRAICKRYGSAFVASESTLRIGIALDTLDIVPINGLRYRKARGTAGWYIWGGEYSEDDDFFQGLCVEHLAEFCPIVLPYLALAPGFGFVTDNQGYEDVWFDADRASQE